MLAPNLDKPSEYEAISDNSTDSARADMDHTFESEMSEVTEDSNEEKLLTSGAGEGARTLDIQLGKLTLYH